MNLSFRVWNRVHLISLLCSLVSIGLYVYLSFHFYALKYDRVFKDSACNINEILNCNAAHLSVYSSFLGIPLSIWGFCIHSLLLFLLLSVFFRLTELRDLFLKVAFYLSTLLLCGSLVMAFISAFFVKAYCIFCVFLYFISILQWECLRRMNPFQKSGWRSYFFDLIHLVRSWRGILFILILPVVAFFIHQSILRSKNLKDVEVYVKGFVSDWKSSPFVSLDILPSLVKGPKRVEADMVISEFADFLCIHCKNAFLKLESFTKAHPKVRLEFYNYPLDGACNKEIGFKRDFSCRLARSVQCANQWNKGWELHDEIFLNQEEIIKKGLSYVDEFLKEKSNGLNLSWEKLSQCMDLAEVKEAVQSQAALGNRADVQGTPTIFVNGKKLSSGYWIPNLEFIRKVSIKNKVKNKVKKK